ncbi:MAG: RsmB/NOP family class I SAM-dependent RNA methyltransferase [Alphaproteobacteria bacterium]
MTSTATEPQSDADVASQASPSEQSASSPVHRDAPLDQAGTDDSAGASLGPSAGPSARPSVGQGTDRARAATLHCLGQVLRKRRAFDEVLAQESADGVLAGLDVRDRAFTRAVTATTLRRLGQIDAILEQFLDHPLPKDGAGVHDLLRIGAAQILFMDVPNHAAVDESVSLTPVDRFKGLVNAVLRRVAHDGAALERTQDAARINTPDWLWASWENAYGLSAARAIGEQHLEEPPLDLWVPRNREAWSRRLQATELPIGTLRRPLADVRHLMGFTHGAWWVQDAAASLPVRLLRPVPGQPVVDLCAAPGGKTMQLAAMGAEVFAVDRSANRLKRIQENLDRVHLPARLVEMDATTWIPETPVHRILLDAPCTATGTIRRHPDIPHLKTPGDVEKLTALQDRLLGHALDHLAPGGLLVFCTCSLQPEEGPERIEPLLASRADVERVPIDAEEIDGFEEAVTRDGDLRTLPCIWPDLGGMDGFFAARLRKKS